jgi:hypothetical protein
MISAELRTELRGALAFGRGARGWRTL